MTIRCFIFDMGRIDGNLACLLFGRTINIFVGHALGPSLFGQDLGNGLRQGRLSVIDMTNGSNVDVRLVPRERFARKGACGEDAIQSCRGGVCRSCSCSQ